MGKIDEKIKNKRCSITVRMNPEMKDKFTAKVKSENRKINDVIREYIEYYSLGYVDQSDNIVDSNNKNVTLWIGDKRRRALDMACNDMGLNMSALVRNLIDDFLKVKGYYDHSSEDEVDKNQMPDQ